MDEKARAATWDLIDQLEREHPDETADQIFERYRARLAADADLRDDALRGVLELVRNEMVDKFFEKRKKVPPRVKKPH